MPKIFEAELRILPIVFVLLTGFLAPNFAQSAINNCIPGAGKDYQVGPYAGQLPELDKVPWSALAPGDTVRIFYRTTPYRGKFIVAVSGTVERPVRICGVKNASGLRPIIDGQNAITRRGLDYGDNANTQWLHQTRSVILIKQLGAQAWQAFPRYIAIHGLEIRGGHPSNSFTDTDGIVRKYTTFGACIWIQRGQNITISDNIIHGCSQGLLTKSTDDGDFAVTKYIRIASNYFYDNGIVGDDHEHHAYTASMGIVFEANRFGPLRTGALGNLIKDRSAGTVIRYNRLEGGAHAIDLVEAEDFPRIATASASYRKTFVYGNQIIKSGDTGSAIHYGGDHYGSAPGANWGEPWFRQGTLYFYNNSIRLTGRGAVVFQLSTTLERAEVWNNVFYFDPSVTYPSMRSSSGVNTRYWTPGGVVNLGRNWVNSNAADSDPWHPVPGQLLGTANLIKGTAAPFNTTSLTPIAGSVLIDRATSAPSAAVASAVAGYPINYQYAASIGLIPRTTKGAAPDIGAIEY